MSEWGTVVQDNVVVILFKDAEANNLKHQIRNFAEDLEEKLKTARLATVRNADTATERVFVDVMSESRVKRTKTIVEECLKRHLLMDRCAVTVLSEAS